MMNRTTINFVPYILIALCLIECSCTFLFSIARSPFRPKDPLTPQLEVRYVGETKAYSISDSHIEEYPTFSFSHIDFDQNRLPDETLNPIHPDDTAVTGAELKNLIRNLIKEARLRKKTFTDFTVLQYKNFNRKRRSGLLVLKAKKYPYVIKLFMENPKTFTTPYRKGIEPIVFFFMAGGANRHLSGLTRIKNREYVQKKLATMDQWKNIVYMPRKWLWIPENEPWLDITGYNIGGKAMQHTQLPSVYVIIADAIKTDVKNIIPSRKRKSIIMKLCNDLDLFIDPHTNNYVFQPANTTLGYQISLLDTEHFPTIAGFKKKVYCKTHLNWYGTLMGKCLHDMYFRTKCERLAAQQEPNYLAQQLMQQ